MMRREARCPLLETATLPRKIEIVAVLIIALVMSVSAEAELVSRLNGQAVYDTERDLTWLADVSLARTSGFDADGLLTWDEANAWAAGLSIAGVDGWRLPTTLEPDPNCVQLTPAETDSSFYFLYYRDCDGSEMGDLFYNALGVPAFSSVLTSTVPELSLFRNFSFSSAYWSSTEDPNNPSFADAAWSFGFADGIQHTGPKVNRFVWAVRDGDVATQSTCTNSTERQDFSTWTVSDASVVGTGAQLTIGTGGTGSGYDDGASKAFSIDLTPGTTIILEQRVKLESGGRNYRLPAQTVTFGDSSAFSVTYLLDDPPGTYGWLFGTNADGGFTGIADPEIPGTGFYLNATADYWAVTRLELTSTGGVLSMKKDDAVRGWFSNEFIEVASASWEHSQITEIAFEQPWDSVNRVDYFDITVPDTTAPQVTAALNAKGKVEEDEGKFRVAFSCSDTCDTDPRAHATLNGIPVANGQLVKLEIDNHSEARFGRRILKLEAPSFTLEVECEDSAGNLATATAAPAFRPDHDRDHRHRRRHHRRH